MPTPKRKVAKAPRGVKEVECSFFVLDWPPERGLAPSLGFCCLWGEPSGSFSGVGPPSFLLRLSPFLNFRRKGGESFGSAMSRQRDILPLPSFDLNLFDRNLVSRSISRRLSRKNRTVEWANDGIHTLHRLGCGISKRPLDAGPPGAGTRAAVAHIHHAYASLGKPPDSITFEGALSELLSGAGYYNDSRVDIAPYDKDRVSWPDKGAIPVPLAAHLDKADCENLANWESFMLRDKQDFRQHISNSKTCKPYCDPSLFASRKTYADFLLRRSKTTAAQWTHTHPPHFTAGLTP